MRTGHCTEDQIRDARSLYQKGKSDSWNDDFRAAIATLPEPPITNEPLPITDPMPPITEGCTRFYFGTSTDGDIWTSGYAKEPQSTHYLDVKNPVNEERQKFDALCDTHSISPYVRDIMWTWHQEQKGPTQ